MGGGGRSVLRAYHGVAGWWWVVAGWCPTTHEITVPLNTSPSKSFRTVLPILPSTRWRFAGMVMVADAGGGWRGRTPNF